MFVLPPALAALGAHRQFIVYHVVPSTTRPGKTDKFPINAYTGRVTDAHNPSIWLDWQTAATMAEAFGPNYGVGFVFTADLGMWFIDVDDCLVDGQWSPIAMELMGRFPGAAWEVSLSLRGLHGIGRGIAPADRRVKYLHLFDLYTEGRFVALTGTNIVGDASTEHTTALTALCAQYLVKDTGDVGEWSAEPVAAWRGPEDDAVLVERALRSSSAGSTFGSRASFADLWNLNVDVLARMYPPDHKDASAYDESRADSALAQHLAFWTGKNCERIERLMHMSGLAREKYNRPGYLKTTIELVVARQYDVLIDKPAEELAVVKSQQPNAVQGRAVTGETYLSATEQLKLFQGCIYVSGAHRVLVPGGHLLKPEVFRVVYGGYSFPMDPMNERISRNAWEAFTESQSVRHPRADKICFRPDLDPGAIIMEAGQTAANVWWPIETPSAEGDAGRFLLHVGKLLPVENDRAQLLAYMAALVQYPGVKFQWAPLIQGVKGNGKTLLFSCVAQAVGDRYTHFPNAKDLSDNGLKFTAWLHAKLFIGIEEIRVADRRDILDALNPIITNSRVEIQAKGQDQITGDNRANIMAGSNHKDAIPWSPEERRWAIYYTAQQSLEDLSRDGMDGNYFPDLYDWLHGRAAYVGHTPGFAIVTYFLKHYAIPDALNPAVQSHRAPYTSSTPEAMEMSVGSIEQEIKEACEQGLPGFAGGWISSMALDKLLSRLKADRRIPPGKRREVLQRMGYDYHPALEPTNGRVNNPVAPDGGKPKLFIKKGHILSNLPTPAAVAAKYSDDQTAAMTASAKFGVANP